MISKVILLASILISTSVIAGEQDQNRSKTNVNEITDFFNSQISDKASLENTLEHHKQDAQKALPGNQTFESLGIKQDEAETKSLELNSINANDLENNGRLERSKKENEFYEALEIDYSSSMVTNHKKDVDLIAVASNKLVSRLTEGLKNLGVDCMQVKGNKVIEPQMFLDIKKEHSKDTVYKRQTCEIPRNKYNCHDWLSLKCKTKGMLWGNWEDRLMEFSGDEINQHWKWMWYSHKLESNFFICYFRADSDVSDGLRSIIAQRLGVTTEQIGDMHYGYEGWRSSTGTSKEYMFPIYEVYYKYRTGIPACLEWDEEWNEVCNLQ